MKLISKYKDYYDYLTGIYGIDKKLVLDRTKFISIKDISFTERDKVTFYICGFKIEGFHLNGQFYYLDELKQFAKPIDKWDRYWGGVDENQYSIIVSSLNNKSEYFQSTVIIDENKINEQVNCPILIKRQNGLLLGKIKIKSRYSSFSRTEDIHLDPFPILKEFNIQSVFTPEQLYLMLYNWLSKTKDIPNNLTDKEKIVGHGFDLKHSFRNTK